MRNFILALRWLTIAAFFCTSLSCRKEVNNTTPSDLLATIGERTIKVNQAIYLYDSTFVDDGWPGDDSLNFISPPPSRVYNWTITPADDLASFSGPYKQGVAYLTFNHSGNYQVSAKMYDSLGQRLIGHTDTFSVNVVSDTLYQYLAIHPDDQLLLSPAGFYNPDDTISAGIGFNISTLESYPYAPMGFLQVIGYTGYSFQVTQNNASFVFSDSLVLLGFPFAYGINKSGSLIQEFGIPNVPYGIPQNLSITWLGKTYTGTFTIYKTSNPANQFTYTWDNSGPVKFTN